MFLPKTCSKVLFNTRKEMMKLKTRIAIEMNSFVLLEVAATSDILDKSNFNLLFPA